MLIDVTELVNRKISKKSIHLEFDQEPFMDCSESVEFNKPTILIGQFVRNDDLIDFSGKVSTELVLTCSRCLEKFIYNINFEIYQSFSVNQTNDFDVFNIENNVIEFDNIIKNNIIAVLPIKRLCGEECKGLCPYCGVDLNTSTCSCLQLVEAEKKKEEEKIDPRFAKLKNLLNDDN